MIVVRCIQRDVFQDEISTLLDKGRLSLGSKLVQLDPIIDDKDLLRVGGRLKKSSFLYGVKHPIIIPRDSHITSLIIRHYHEKTMHQGRGLTMNAIRSSGIWIVGCTRAVSTYIFKCGICRRLRGNELGQKMSDLPVEQLDDPPAFTFVGIDCFGPFAVKDGRKISKRYGLIVTCLSTRAIHIECLDDMTSNAFINGLRCVIAIRGPIRTIKCDQGSNFRGAAHELKVAMAENLEEDVIKRYLLSQTCEFAFNSPYSSHMGGIWERCIRTVRSVLNTIL